MKAFINDNRIYLRFSYNQEVITKIKYIAGRKWHPFPIKLWSVPLTEENTSILKDIGFNVADINMFFNNKINEEHKQEQIIKEEINTMFHFLFPYQQEAIIKGIINKKLYLADDMGLGKTITSASILEYFMRKKDITKSVIICQKTAIPQTIRNIKNVINVEYKEMNYVSDINTHIITTYDKASNNILIIKPLINNQGLIIDEATKIKNPTRKRTKNLSTLTPKIAVFNSGTPYETKLTDVYNVSNILYPKWMTKEEYYSYCNYVEHPYAKRINKDGDKVPVMIFTGYKHLDRFAKRWQEISIRRKYEDVADQAIKKIYYNPIVEQTTLQHKLSRLITEKLITEKKQNDFISTSTLLQEVSINPKILLKTKSPYMLRILREHKKLYEEIDNSSSPKLDYLKDIIINDDCEYNDNKIVIFSRFIRMRLEIERLLREHKHNVYDITTLNDFKLYQGDKKCFIILGDSSIHGIDIPEATTLINMDILWNPAHMEQRENRIRRITSKHNVKIITIISKGIEEYVHNYMQRCKDIGESITTTQIENKLKEYIIAHSSHN